jgi:hypothetical protein
MLMKKLYILALFVLLCGFTANSQIYVTADAAFPKFGLFSNHAHTFGPVGMYQYAQYGHTKKYEFDVETVKLGTGASVPICKGNLVLYGGINHQWFFNVYDNSPYFDLENTYPTSFDLGISRNDYWGSILFVGDPLNREVMLGLHYRFLHNKLKYRY